MTERRGYCTRKNLVCLFKYSKTQPWRAFYKPFELLQSTAIPTYAKRTKLSEISSFCRISRSALSFQLVDSGLASSPISFSESETKLECVSEWQCQTKTARGRERKVALHNEDRSMVAKIVMGLKWERNSMDASVPSWSLESIVTRSKWLVVTVAITSILLL